MYVAKAGTNNSRRPLPSCGNFNDQDTKTTVVVNEQPNDGVWIEKCKLRYLAGTDTKGSESHIHALTFYFTCKE